MYKKGSNVGRPKGVECRRPFGRTGKPSCRKSARVKIILYVKSRRAVTYRCYEHFVELISLTLGNELYRIGSVEVIENAKHKVNL
jgi:hypothetical protein